MSNFRVRFSTLPTIGRWLPTLENAGIPGCGDPLSGDLFGVFITTSSINPTNWTQSEARNAYIDPLHLKANLHTLTNIINLIATSFGYGFVKCGSRSSVQVRKEVIVFFGGPIGSPHVLLHNGVEPSDVSFSAIRSFIEVRELSSYSVTGCWHWCEGALVEQRWVY